MMSFCRKSVQAFLAHLTATSSSSSSINDSTTTITTPIHKPHPPSWNYNSQTGGLNLVTDDVRHSSPNVLESPVVKSLPSTWPVLTLTTKKKDPGGIGFIDDIGGGVNGLMSCTESLGFESSDERRVDDDHDVDDDGYDDHDHDDCESLIVRPRFRKKPNKSPRTTEKKRPFPPPLSSLNRNGQPSFYLRPMRKDGRLELTEVRLNRPEILRAYREDGRLRLHLIRDDDHDSDRGDDDDHHHDYDEPLPVHNEDYNEEEEEEENYYYKEVNGEWKFPVSNGEGFRRCHELVNHHHHHGHSNHNHNLHVWRQHCVTTR